MRRNENDPGSRPGATSHSPTHPGSATADMSQVLVVGRSQVNRIVIAKIVERSGLKPVAESPETALTLLGQRAPGTIILDGGSDNNDCEALMPSIVALRLASGGKLPSVILLSNKAGSPESLSVSSAIDIVVAKPITPERLQPVIEKLVGRV